MPQACSPTDQPLATISRQWRARARSSPTRPSSHADDPACRCACKPARPRSRQCARVRSLPCHVGSRSVQQSNPENWSAARAEQRGDEIGNPENRDDPLFLRSPEYGASLPISSCPTSPCSVEMGIRRCSPASEAWLREGRYHYLRNGPGRSSGMGKTTSTTTKSRRCKHPCKPLISLIPPRVQVPPPAPLNRRFWPSGNHRLFAQICQNLRRDFERPDPCAVIMDHPCHHQLIRLEGLDQGAQSLPHRCSRAGGRT